MKLSEFALLSRDQPDRGRLMSTTLVEVWRPVPGLDGYEASSHGRVRSLDRWVQQNGRKDRWWAGKVLSPQVVGKGYLKVHLGHTRQQLVHQLVALAFLGPCPEGCEVAHDDGNPLNNHIGNLRYDTRAGNHHDKRRHGTHIEGKRIPWAKLTEEDVLAIRSSPATHAELGRLYGCTGDNIAAIRSRKSWKHL